MSACGCWTDAGGYWRLSPECREVERKAWADMMERSNSGYYTELFRQPRETMHDRAVAYFRQELGTPDIDKVQARSRIDRNADVSDVTIYHYREEGDDA